MSEASEERGGGIAGGGEKGLTEIFRPGDRVSVKITPYSDDEDAFTVTGVVTVERAKYWTTFKVTTLPDARRQAALHISTPSGSTDYKTRLCVNVDLDGREDHGFGINFRAMTYAAPPDAKWLALGYDSHPIFKASRQ